MGHNRETIERQWFDCRESGKPLNVEYPVHLADGTVRVIWTHGRPVRTHDGRLRWVGVNIDVTDRERTKEELQIRTSALQQRTADLQRANEVLANETARHQAVANALRESEARLRAILDNTSAVVYLVDRDNCFLHINRRWQEVFGLTNERVQGRSIYEFFPKEAADRFRDNNQRVLSRGAPLEFEEVVEQSDGPHTYITVKVPICNSSGTPYAVCGISTDITERKRIELERESALATLNNLIESAPLGIALFDRDKRYRLVNHPLAAMNGIARDAHIGKTPWEIVPDIVPQVEPVFDQVLGTGEPVLDHIIEGKTALAPGERRVWRESWFPVPEQAGRPVGVGVIVQEITEQRRSEEQLRRKNERLALLSEASAVLLQADDPNAMLSEVFAKIAPHCGLDVYFHFVLNASQDALQIASCAGVPEDQARSFSRLELGQAICGTVAISRQPVVAAHIQTSDDTKAEVIRSFGVRAYFCCPLLLGEQFLGTLSFGSRSRDEFDADELHFLQTICHYVTVAYERVRLIAQLRDADRRKDEFLATLGHELRNPLAPIQNALELLRRSEGNGDVVREAQSLIDRQLQRMVRLIDDLLDIARITSGKIRLRKERVELAAVVRSAVEAARPLVEAQGHQLTVTLAPEPVLVDADPTRLAQVFANLLDNASKYTDRGGHIWLTAERNGGEAVVTVRDTGIGIAADDLPHLFVRFSQTASALERSRGGLGIGLSLVKGILELHSGTIAVRSDGIGKGSEFTVRLPVAQASALPSQESRDDAAPTRPALTRRILVVDDNRDSADSLSMLLRFKGHEVLTAYDGLEAVQAAAASQPDVILLDIGLPKLSGYEVARRIRAEPWGAKIAMIAMTGWGQEDDKRRALEAGCDHHLTKPVAAAVLEKLLAVIGPVQER